MTAPAHKTVNHLLLARRDQQPSSVAYHFLGNGEAETESITREELAARALSTAAALKRIGLVPGDRALILLPPGIEFITSFFGSLLAGVIAVPAYPPRPNRRDPRLLAIIQDAGAGAVLTTSELESNIRDRFAELTGRLPVCLAADSIADPSLDDPVEAQTDSLAFLQYTSGSTGCPKGVMVRHGNILDNLAYIRDAFQLHEESLSLSWLPPFHDMGLIDGILQPLFLGTPGRLMPPAAFLQRPARWLEAVSRYRVTHSGGPDFGYNLCVEKVDPSSIADADLSCWRSAYSGAEPVRPSTLERFTRSFAALGFRSQAFYPCYGLAESTLMVSGGELTAEPVVRAFDQAVLTTKHLAMPSNGTEARATRLTGVGHAYRDTRIVIVDPESLEPMPQGAIGEILVCGSSVAAGYWNRPDESRAVFEASVPGFPDKTFLRTGDLGFFDRDELFIAGRSKDLIIIRGENHYPQDIELTAEDAHPSVRKGCVAAFTVEGEHGEQLVVVAEIQRAALNGLDSEAVINAIREAVSLEHELLARSIVLIRTGTIPRTSSGKIRRSACRQDWLDGALQETGRSDLPEPAAAAEPLMEGDSGEDFDVKAWLTKQLAHHLHLDPEHIDPSIPFAQYGLDSSVALGLTGELGEHLGVDLPPTLLWDYPTIDDVSRHVESELPRPTAA